MDAWSPDGERIVYSGNASYSSERDRTLGDIYVMDTNGRNSQKLTNTGSDYSPSWSPDGERITFMSYRDGNSEIYAMDADGKNPQNLTNHPAEDWSPSWSPDGERIAFSSDRDGPRDGPHEIYVMDADGGNPRRLTNHPEADWDCPHGPLMVNGLPLYLIGVGVSTST